MSYLEMAKEVMLQGQESLEAVLSGHAVELWSDSVGRLFMVADEADARRLLATSDAQRGEVYTADEVRRVCSIKDSAVVREIHNYKRMFNGIVAEAHGRKP